MVKTSAENDPVTTAYLDQLITVSLGRPHHLVSSLQFSNGRFIEPQEVDEVVQFSTHAYLVRSWVQPPHMVWPHSVQMLNAPSPNLVE